MITLILILAGIQILLAIYGLWQAFSWRRFVQRSLQSATGIYTPRVAVICPLKGAEPELEANLTALTLFDYPDYELFFVLAGTHDPAHEVVRRVMASSRRPAHVVLAGEPSGCAEKVNNLRVAVERLPPGFGVLVFADSDGRPGRRWLAQMVASLADSKIGAATTFRWLLPGAGLASALASAWNAPIVSLLGGHKRNFCWGGGTAIRRETFDDAGVLESWQGAASDDWAMTRALRAASRRIEFLPQCLVPSRQSYDLKALLEFTNRQITITRVYAPDLWAGALALHGSYTLTVLFGLVVLVGRAAQGRPVLHIALLLSLVLLLSALRGLVRLLAVADVWPERQPELLRQSWVWTFLSPLVPLLYTWNLSRAALTRRIHWRGYIYELISPRQTRIVAR